MYSHMHIAYIGLESPEPALVARYFSDVVGLMPGQPLADGALTWRNDHKTHRVWVKEGGRKDAVCIGFETKDATVWRETIDRLQRLNLQVVQGTPEELVLRRVSALARVRAPWGVDVEIVQDLADADTPFAASHYPGGFVTGGQGFGHAVFAMSGDDYEAAKRFCLEGLGMGLSDWLRLPLGPPGVEMHVSFLHCNARHHSLALACVPGPMPSQALNHINFEVAGVEAVGQAHDRALQTKTPLANTIGQHDNDGMVSFYSISPDGWRVEVGATGRLVGPDWNDVREYDRISRWGHQQPAALVGLLAAD